MSIENGFGAEKYSVNNLAGGASSPTPVLPPARASRKDSKAWWGGWTRWSMWAGWSIAACMWIGGVWIW